MLHTKPLSEPEKLTLQEMHHQHPRAWTRKRAHAVLLRARGYAIQEIAAIYEVSRQAVSSWLNAWEDKGIRGLVDEDRSGRPQKLSEDEQKQRLEWLDAEPRSIKQVQAKVKQHFGKTLSVSSIKRICKKARLVWKRMRRSLKGKRDPQAYQRSEARLLSSERAAVSLNSIILINQVSRSFLVSPMPGRRLARRSRCLARRAGV